MVELEVLELVAVASPWDTVSESDSESLVVEESLDDIDSDAEFSS